ncbi:hypothetical protein DSM106972_083260 [Dulcicalothrix desertica PCC 7102]|uniref:DUF3592 domain-containing protein n=1 Tax=Dulcicalothrix desertica PCC 7102 TaxID=232991 RepID=A0A3S1C6P8_9CYAN|nr:DUF3592 domain-containing protein [Dulcicalothrix desertica]RUS97589.1 hypothetical protein DSM106972_083260 [Dulcicalothrix desertica PCC 7102]TWH54798.1 uncharacterized protein DUF3592 [Dulcicalothrix desertica PCC 7102]
MQDFFVEMWNNNLKDTKLPHTKLGRLSHLHSLSKIIYQGSGLPSLNKPPVGLSLGRVAAQTMLAAPSATGRPPAYTKGQQVEVLYNPQQPESATIYSWLEMWLFPIIFTGVGSVAVAIGGIPLFKSFFPRK